jgi:hypothetical protein
MDPITPCYVTGGKVLTKHSHVTSGKALIKHSPVTSGKPLVKLSSVTNEKIAVGFILSGKLQKKPSL